MNRSKPLRAASACLALLPVLLAGAGAAWAQAATSTQTSPLATEPLPAQGPGQAATGAAVTGSAPGAGPSGTPSPGPPPPSPIDNSQAQQGVLLKPGPAADDMGAAAGAHPPAPEQPR